MANHLDERRKLSLRLLGAFEIASNFDMRLRLNLVDAVPIHLKLLIKVEFSLTSAPDLEVD